ncbi:nucleotide exchange factor GrpE [Candidatus Roizmanbacteria bacterium RIFCSPHIGHO2_02_FULL_39_9]|uniref:Protein GrpE n=2 Tax=Candidatus Roizmaniibacteriota TaxID=1752723 RepID=A0A1F7HAD9_9BACT|nr:MAG: nucleotide exchange factor GrpE [Candidatus Roizmanbacteria bacterium RIFCSPHIGHO2_02_FULL_39_9]
MNDQKINKQVKPGNQEIEKLKKGIEELKKQAEEYRNKYLRALADYQNYEKREREEKNQVQELAITHILVRLLPFLDHLEKAEVFIKDKGLKMVKDNFEKVLESIGLEQIDATGKEFDPHTAEAIEIVDGDRDNIVKEVIRRGYKRNGKVIRVAQVRVSKKSEIRNPKS